MLQANSTVSRGKRPWSTVVPEAHHQASSNLNDSFSHLGNIKCLSCSSSMQADKCRYVQCAMQFCARCLFQIYHSANNSKPPKINSYHEDHPPQICHTQPHIYNSRTPKFTPGRRWTTCLLHKSSVPMTICAAPPLLKRTVAVMQVIFSLSLVYTSARTVYFPGGISLGSWTILERVISPFLSGQLRSTLSTCSQRSTSWLRMRMRPYLTWM